MKKVFFALCVVLGASISFAAPAFNEIWQQANAHYQNKEYDKAAALYEQLAAGRPDNAAVYYNLGNAYYKLNQIGPAVLNYERALRVDPGHRLAADNLELTKSRIPNRVAETPDIFFVAWWKSATAAGLSEIWSVTALALFIIAIVLLALRRLDKAPGWMPRAVPAVALILTPLFLLLAYTSASRRADNRKAVVMEHDTPLHQTNGKKGINHLPEGTVVTISELGKDKAEVRLPDGRTGWVDPQTLEKI